MQRFLKPDRVEPRSCRRRDATPAQLRKNRIVVVVALARDVAERRGVGLASYKAAEATDERRPALVVGYATPPEYAFDGAIAKLCAVPEETSARRGAIR